MSHKNQVPILITLKILLAGTKSKSCKGKKSTVMLKSYALYVSTETLPFLQYFFVLGVGQSQVDLKFNGQTWNKMWVSWLKKNIIFFNRNLYFQQNKTLMHKLAEWEEVSLCHWVISSKECFHAWPAWMKIKNQVWFYTFQAQWVNNEKLFED